jgi:gpW
MTFMPPISGPFIGMSQAALITLRSQAQTALASLVLGGMPVTLTYSSGDGQKSVTYGRTNEASLRNFIGELNAALGQGRRSAVSVAFR